MVAIQRFLEVLFPELAESFIEVRRIRPDKKVFAPVFYESVEQLLIAMPGYIQEPNGNNTYFGVCPRSRKEGTKNTIKQVFSLWVDLDGKRFPGGKEEAFKRLKEFLFLPTLIVDSGNGYHAYWRLKEAETIKNLDDIAKIERFLKGLARVLEADTSAAELARVLRLPGTHNLKQPSAPKPVNIISMEEERQYNLSDFELFLSEDEAVKKINPPGWIAQALDDLQAGNRNITITKIAGRLHHDGWLPSDILSLLTPHAKDCGLLLAELDQIIASVTRYPSNKSSPSSQYNSEETETESKPLEALPLEMLLEGGEQNIEWRIECLLPKEGVGILAGPAGYGKSWMLLDLAIECARGGKWLGHFMTTSCNILYVDEESSSGLLRKRLRKLLGAKKLPANGQKAYFCVGQGICLTKPGSVERLRQLIDALRPGLVIVDSLIRVHRAEENSASDMSQVFAVVKGLVREFGCSFLFADHQRKPSNWGVSLDLMLRGSSEKTAFVDTLLSLQKKYDALIVEHSKSRYDEAVPAFVVQIKDFEPETTTVAYSGEAEALKQQARQEAARELLLSILIIDEWIARKALIERAKEANVSEKALDETLKAFLLEGRVEREDRKTEGRGGKSAFYRLKADSFPSPEQEMETETK